ncbi:MAG: DNA polymerase III subunit delta [Candidatus Pacebacteria bacterium]|nr:DNA polymerase III subunit delta [Candidatus Paceibacterota bacterium]
MIIFLSGEDTYRLIENRESVIKSYQAKHGSGFNFFRVDGASASAGADVASAIKSVSLFSEVKLILVSNIFSNLKMAEELHELFVKYDLVGDKGVVVLATHSGTAAQAKPKEFLSFLSDSKNLVRNFVALEGVQLQTWLKKEASIRGVTFATGAISRFLAVAGVDSWSRINNLDKLAGYTGGVVSISDINLLIQTESEPNVFEFIEALGAGRRPQAFSLLSGELAFGRDPYYLLSMVIYQFRNMLIVKDFVDRNIPPSEISKKSGIHPFVIKKMTPAINRFSLTELKDLYQRVVDLEQGTKQGKRDLEDGLFSLVLG